ncbi:MAG: protein phosphatase 2C domain-containing protein [Polyangiaceae bacterium]
MHPPGDPPASTRQLALGGATDIGKTRERNEDSYLVLPDFRLMVVADGIGGHRSGMLASQLAVSTLHDFFVITVRPDATWPFPYDERLSDEENYLSTGVRLANRRIFDRSLKTLTDFGMGTTCVGAMFDASLEHVVVAHVGDSRAYRVRGDTITQLTRDHSLVSDALEVAPWITTEEIAQLPANVVTRALGIREEVEVDLRAHDVEVGDVYIVCSDGLSSQVSDARILEVVARGLASNGDDVERVGKELLKLARDAGGADNATVCLAVVR